MAKPSVFVSFDYDNDRQYKYLLEAWNANPKFQFVFNDETPDEIDTYNVGRIKAALTVRIRAATHTLVIIGRFANSPHPKRHLIGYRNWINFEVAQSIAAGNRIAAIKLDRSFESPEELQGAQAAWAMAFDQAPIIRALEQA